MPALPPPKNYAPTSQGDPKVRYTASQMLPDGEALVPGMVPECVAHNLLRMERRWAKRKGERSIHNRLENLWRNARWSDATLKHHAESVERSRDIKPHFFPNLLRQIIQPLSYIYDAPPARTAAQPKDEEWMRASLWDFCEKGHLDWLMTQADTLVRLHGTVWAQIVFRPSRDVARDFRYMVRKNPTVSFDPASGEEVETGEDTLLDFSPDESGFDLMFFAPHRFEVAPNDMDPTQADAVWLLTGDDAYEGDLTESTELEGYANGYYWDGRYFGHTKGFTLVPDAAGFLVCEHGIGEIPGLPMRNEPTTRDFWIWGIGGQDAHQDLLDIAKVWREYLFTAMLCRGQYFVKGDLKAGNSESFGPDTIFRGEENADMKNIASGADLEGMRTAINSASEAFARGCNIPASLVRLTEGEQAPKSGRAMLLETAELEEDRPTRETIFSQIEYGIHRRVAAARMAILNERTNIRPSQVAGLGEITFGQHYAKLSQSDQLIQVTFELDRGLIGKERALRVLHPEASDDTIREWLAAAQVEMAAAMPTPAAAPGPQPPTGAQAAPQDQDNARTNPPGEHPANP